MNVKEPFTVGRGIVLKQLILSPSTGWPVWCALFSGVALAVAGCFTDDRLMVLGLMICVCVIPAVVAFVYFFHILSPDMVANLLPHTLERRPDGYTLRIWSRSEPEDGSKVETCWKESGRVMLYDSDIVASKSTFDYEMLFFKDSRMKILYVPRF